MRLPIGYSDFKKLIDNECTFVDKTLLIKEIIDDSAEVILITRPRRFGKTLNFSMLRYFFERPLEEGRSNKYLFDTYEIAQEGEQYLKHQEKYPVISISFKDLKHDTFNGMYVGISQLIAKIYAEHRNILTNGILHEEEINSYKLILQQKASKNLLEIALQNLTHYLDRYYKNKPIILIDEYDTPIQAGYTYGYYEEIVSFMRIFLGATLKDNIHLHKAVLTGILRVAKENIFSGLNNLEVYTILRSEYGEYFGFLEQEVDDLFKEAKLDKDPKNIKDWYNGYQIGERVVYNPWSIINCIKNQGKLIPYWVNTSDNTLIKDLIAQSGQDFKGHFEMLLNGEQLQEYIDPNIIYSDLQGSEASIWTLLLMSGYLKVTSCVLADSQYICTLQIPNKEVLCLYDDIVKKWLFGRKNLQWYNRFLQYIRAGNMEGFEQALQEIVLDMFSFHDTGSKQPENFYHGFTMGLIASLREEYYIESNRESGLGRYDLALIPKAGKCLALVFEFKSGKEGAIIEKVAQDALQQIDTKKYTTALCKYKVKTVLKIGIAFVGKEVFVKHTKCNLDLC